MFLQSGTNWFIAQMSTTTIDEQPVTLCSIQSECTLQEHTRGQAAWAARSRGTCMGTQRRQAWS